MEKNKLTIIIVLSLVYVIVAALLISLTTNWLWVFHAPFVAWLGWKIGESSENDN